MYYNHCTGFPLHSSSSTHTVQVESMRPITSHRSSTLDIEALSIEVSLVPCTNPSGKAEEWAKPCWVVLDWVILLICHNIFMIYIPMVCYHESYLLSFMDVLALNQCYGFLMLCLYTKPMLSLYSIHHLSQFVPKGRDYPLDRSPV